MLTNSVPEELLLEKMTVAQLVKNFTDFYKNPKFHYRVHKGPPPN
jgi:hypothetical protein